MIKRLLSVLIILLLGSSDLLTQTLVSTYPFPANTAYNGFWGITQINDTLRIGSSSSGMIYKVTKTGSVLDSLTTPFNFNNGLAWDGSGFWIARNASGTSSRLIKVNLSGVPVDTISFANIAGSSTVGIGGVAIQGNALWFAVYFPDYTTYPFAYAYKVDIATGQFLDTIPLRGKQVQGITVKGDTIFYVTDNFQSDPERIYAYRDAVGDTLFSFPAPDPDGDCDPRGLYWDGASLWLMAYRVGGTTGQFRTLYKYSLSGSGSPLITTSVSSVNFGNVVIGSTGTFPLTINNVGTGTLVISNFTNTNPRFTLTPNTVPVSIPAGGSQNFTLGFTPTVFDTTSGELRIASNDLGNPVKVVTQRGKGVYNGAYFFASVNSFNYNNRRINSLSGFTFNITNQGTQPLVINNCNLSSSRFRFDTTNARFPITIDTQRTRTLRIWFNPNAAATFSDSAIFSTNAVNNSSAKISITGAGVDNPPVLGNIMWESTIPDNPLTSADDFQPKSMKQIPDVNFDGVADMVVATENYWTICYNGNSSVTADTLWKFNSCFGTNNTGSVDWEDAMQIMDDLNGDGIKEVVIGCGGGNEEVYVLSGGTGRVIWEYPGPGTNYDGDINGMRIDKDYNSDGKKDVLISASGEGPTNPGRHAVICLNAVNGNVIFNTVQNCEFTHDVTATTSGGAIGTASNGGPYSVQGFNNTGGNTWSYPVTSAVWSLREIPDINGDGSSDIVGLWGFNGTIMGLSGSTGAQIYINNLASSNNGTVEILDDKDHNGFVDLTFSGPQTAYRIDSKNNNLMWTKFFGASYIRDAGLLGDISGDSIAEVLYATQQPGRVFVLNGENGNELFQYEFGTNIGQRADRVNALNSIDDNSTNEFVAGCRDGRIKCFDGGPGVVIGIISSNTEIPESFALHQNYPNPFNPATNIKFDIPTQSFVKLSVFDILGREVEILVNSELLPGVYNADWNASSFASGVYFFRMEAGEFTDVNKMVLVK
jgi:Secretion system C-terminal sorting domain/Abnormal spindle-like microcephaly-assoc'd, ASPM-SPD-2-Hydin